MPKLSTKPEPCIAEALHRLDRMEKDVTEWEGTFLDNVMRGATWTEAQRRTLAQMVETYLEDLILAAEIRGQQRLF